MSISIEDAQRALDINQRIERIEKFIDVSGRGYSIRTKDATGGPYYVSSDDIPLSHLITFLERQKAQLVIERDILLSDGE